ncbi:NAD-dependent epimerase/dehydratase family protein [Mobilicoccus caccae]|uniref:NAD-dependent epimerase/dehydratase domain-containing protein n=1 Tax=Mobilicoccus caccae TaxID=1859295 RepID=A0ABQ6IMV0_9MICO|nr:NAD-dependent epimerase/dehydratase family protein [Mobilicoccus caccae]GMA38431.1 hypothetical protein GCM10025883_04760 [Mobilicoccus caccae]
MSTTILVTGVSSYLGAGVARRLAGSPDVDRVIGVDVQSPAFPLGGAEFLRTDVRNPILGRVVRQAEIGTLVHFGAVPTTGSRSARTSQREATVIGTMQLLGLCQAVPALRHVVLASTGSVYGASASSPAIVTEQSPVNVRARAGHVRDAIEVESYVRALAQRRPDVGVSVLRLTHVFGTHTRSAMSNYLRAPVVPVPFGFDARLQALHEDDAVGALVTAAAGEPVGTVNVAGDGILTLRQALRIARRPSVPVLTTTGRALGALTRWAGVSDVDPDHIDYVMYGRCLDVRRMREVLGFTPRLTTRETFEWFAQETWGVAPSHTHLTRPGPGAVADLPDDVDPADDELLVEEGT